MSDITNNNLLTNRAHLIIVIMCIISGITGCALLTGCSLKNDNSSELSEYEDEIYAMDTYMSITVYARGDNGTRAIDEAENRIRQLDNMLSTGNVDSEVSKLNKSREAKVSEDVLNLAVKSENISEMTDGAFDITIYPLMKLWGFTDDNYKVPSQADIDNTLKAVGASNVHINIDNKEILLDGESQIDYGGIAKGYTSSDIINIFKKNGVENAIVNLGGNVQALGFRPDGSKWRTAIKHPDNDGSYLGVVSVNDKAVITSGGYERFFEQDGKKYHHIIDPHTGYSADSKVLSATVISSDGALADGLSTALFVMGLDKSTALWKNNSEKFDFIIMTDDGRIYITKGLTDDFTSDCEYDVIE